MNDDSMIPKHLVPKPDNPTPISPFKRYAQAVLARRLDGKRLHFDKGAYLAGESDVLFDGTQLVALMGTLKIGWLKWKGSEVVDHALGLVSEGFVPPRRHALDDFDSANWENVKGELRDPWRENNEVVMIDPRTREVFTYTTGSRGGFAAIAQLADGYVEETGMYPLIELRSESYQHKNREYGRIHVPKFPIVKHVDGARFDEILAASRRGGTEVPAIAGETPKPTPDSGRAEAPAETKPAGDDGYGGDYGGHRGPIDDDVPFAPQWM